MMNLKRVVDRKLLFDITRGYYTPCDSGILIQASLKVEVRCPLNYQHYPFDVQSCPLILYFPHFSNEGRG